MLRREEWTEEMIPIGESGWGWVGFSLTERKRERHISTNLLPLSIHNVFVLIFFLVISFLGLYFGDLFLSFSFLLAHLELNDTLIFFLLTLSTGMYAFSFFPYLVKRNALGVIDWLMLFFPSLFFAQYDDCAGRFSFHLIPIYLRRDLLSLPVSTMSLSFLRSCVRIYHCMTMRIRWVIFFTFIRWLLATSGFDALFFFCLRIYGKILGIDVFSFSGAGASAWNWAWAFWG